MGYQSIQVGDKILDTYSNVEAIVHAVLDSTFIADTVRNKDGYDGVFSQHSFSRYQYGFDWKLVERGADIKLANKMNKYYKDYK